MGRSREGPSPRGAWIATAALLIACGAAPEVASARGSVDAPRFLKGGKRIKDAPIVECEAATEADLRDGHMRVRFEHFAPGSTGNDCSLRVLTETGPFRSIVQKQVLLVPGCGACRVESVSELLLADVVLDLRAHVELDGAHRHLMTVLDPRARLPRVARIEHAAFSFSRPDGRRLHGEIDWVCPDGAEETVGCRRFSQGR